MKLEFDRNLKVYSLPNHHNDSIYSRKTQCSINSSIIPNSSNISIYSDSNITQHFTTSKIWQAIQTNYHVILRQILQTVNYRTKKKHYRKSCRLWKQLRVNEIESPHKTIPSSDYCKVQPFRIENQFQQFLFFPTNDGRPLLPHNIQYPHVHILEESLSSESACICTDKYNPKLQFLLKSMRKLNKRRLGQATSPDQQEQHCVMKLKHNRQCKKRSYRRSSWSCES